MNQTKKKTKWKSENLTWVNKSDGGSSHAGIAFYMPKLGEYKMLLDLPRTMLFLRPTGSEDDRVKYTVLAPVYKGNRVVKKIVVGYGYSSSSTNGYVYMSIGPYTHSLCMEVRGQNEKV